MLKNPLVLSLIAALVGALLVHTYLKRFELELAGGKPVQVLSLSGDLALGRALHAEDLVVRVIPEEYVDGRHIRVADRQRVLGAHAVVAVPAGEALLWTDLDVMPRGRTLSGLVRQGMRAVTIDGRALTFAGLLRPGDRVDVLWTRPGTKSAQTRTLLQNVLVLTVGADMGGDGHGRSRCGRGVTLSVTAGQAQTLAHARPLGGLQLALRNPQDVQTLDGLPVVMDRQLLGTLQRVAP